MNGFESSDEMNIDTYYIKVSMETENEVSPASVFWLWKELILITTYCLTLIETLLIVVFIKCLPNYNHHSKFVTFNVTQSFNKIASP